MNDVEMTEIMIGFYAGIYDDSFRQAKQRFARELTEGVSPERATQIVEHIRSDTIDLLLKALDKSEHVYGYINYCRLGDT